MKKLLSIILGVCVAMLAACGGQGSSPDNEATVLQTGSHSGLKDQTEQQIHNQADFQKAWDQIYTGQGSKPALPNVDFTKDTVLVYAVGERKNGGWTIRIDHASATATGYLVGFTVNQPGNNCSRSGNEATDPFIVATVPTAGDVTFDEVKTHQIPPCT